MSKMGQLRYMVENNYSEDKIAWFIFLNVRAGTWFNCKKIAKEMREEYEKENRDRNDLRTE